MSANPMRRPLLLVLVASVALVTAGCLGGGTTDTSASEDGPSSTPSSSPTPNATEENETTETPTPSWSNETREGSFSGSHAGTGEGGLSLGGGAEDWTVEDAALNLTVALASETDVFGDIYPPCDDEGVAGTGLLSDCPSHRIETRDGPASWGTDDPAPGNWTLYVYRSENGYGEVQYTLTLSHLLPPEG